MLDTISSGTSELNFILDFIQESLPDYGPEGRDDEPDYGNPPERWMKSDFKGAEYQDNYQEHCWNDPFDKEKDFSEFLIIIARFISISLNKSRGHILSCILGILKVLMHVHTFTYKNIQRSISKYLKRTKSSEKIR